MITNVSAWQLEQCGCTDGAWSESLLARAVLGNQLVTTWRAYECHVSNFVQTRSKLWPYIRNRETDRHLDSDLLPCDAMLACYVLSPFVCLSVCPSVQMSVTSRHCTKPAKCIMQTVPYDSPGISFLTPEISSKFQRGHPQLGRQIEVG